MPFYNPTAGLAAHAEGHRTTATQPGEHAEGYVTTKLAPEVGYAGRAHLNLESWALGGMFEIFGVQELKIAGGDPSGAIAQRIKIPDNFTFSMEFNVLAVLPDYSVNVWHLLATCQNTGSVVEGIGLVQKVGSASGTTQVAWASDGNGFGGNMPATGPGEESSLHLYFDTDSTFDEIIIRVVGSPTSYVSIHATVTINKMWVTPPADSSS